MGSRSEGVFDPARRLGQRHYSGHGARTFWSISVRRRRSSPSRSRSRVKPIAEERSCQGLVVGSASNPKDVQVILSRSHPSLSRRCLSWRCRKSAEKIVEIKSIVREPGRTKIAVSSRTKRWTRSEPVSGSRGRVCRRWSESCAEKNRHYHVDAGSSRVHRGSKSGDDRKVGIDEEKSRPWWWWRIRSVAGDREEWTERPALRRV